jgi:hypothetical protein
MKRERLLLAVPILTLLAAAPAAATLTVYTNRAAWTAAVSGNVVTEDWTGDAKGNHPTPYATAEGTTFTTLSGSPITLQIFDGDDSDEPREIHFRDFAAGMGVTLPNNGHGFGFDYDTAVEPWTVTANGRATILLPQTNGFVGYVDDSNPVTSFTLRGANAPQGGISLDNLSRVGVRFGGLPHTALGQSHLSQAADGSLVVSNLGSSGNDGVSIHLGEVQAFTTRTVLDSAATPVGAMMRTQILGTLHSLPNQPSGSSGLERTTGGYTALIDYSAIGARTYTARFYNAKGELVQQVHGLHSGTPGEVNIEALAPIRIQLGCTTTVTATSSSAGTTATASSSWAVNLEVPWQVLFLLADSKLAPAPVSFLARTVMFEPETPTVVPTSLTGAQVVGAGMSQLLLTGEAVRVHGFDYQGMGSASLVPAAGNLTISNFGTTPGAGFSTTLGRAETADVSLTPIDPDGRAPLGASVTVQASGSVRGVPGQSLGHLQVTKMADGYMLTPDFSEIGSPTHHLLVYNQGTLVADLPGRTGPAGIAPFWPSRFGKLGGPLECYTSHWPQAINFRVGGTTYAGDEVRTLAEGSPGAIDFKSGFNLQAAKLESLTLTDAAADPAICHPSPTRLCLNGGRFGVETAWKTNSGLQGVGQAVPLTGDTGYFWFFANSNVEMVVKALNGCGFGSHFWVFAGGLTDVMVTMTVTDAQTGLVRTYVNPQGRAFQPLQDTSAFGTCTAESIAAVTGTALPAPKVAEAGAEADAEAADPFFAALEARASSTALLLNNGRFRVETTWQTSQGAQGSGQAVQLTGDTGYFWFFDSGNVEMLVKILNGCGLNQRFWVFAGGLTNVAVTLKVTDTATGLSKTYLNPQGRAFQPIQDTSAFGNCS